MFMSSATAGRHSEDLNRANTPINQTLAVHILADRMDGFNEVKSSEQLCKNYSNSPTTAVIRTIISAAFCFQKCSGTVLPLLLFGFGLKFDA